MYREREAAIGSDGLRSERWLVPAGELGWTLDHRILGALYFIQMRSLQQVTVEAAASGAFLSPSHFRHLFKQQTGFSFHQHLIRVRLSHAHHMIHNTDDPVARVAELLGIQDISHFTRDYKRVYGVSPGAHRGAYMMQGWYKSPLTKG